MTKKTFSKWVFQTLKEQYPDVHSFLTHNSPFQLLIAVILSAQCTDERVNQVTPVLFKRFPDAEALAKANIEDVRQLIRSISYCNTKAKHLIECSKKIQSIFHGKVPEELDLLIQLPGVGRKTANVILGQVFSKPGITVDTHVKRLSYRMGFTKKKDPEKIEYDLQKLWAKDTWSCFSTVLILHGRQTCKARNPQCETCIFNAHCPKENVLCHLSKT